MVKRKKNLTHNLNMVKTRKTLNILRCFFEYFFFFMRNTKFRFIQRQRIQHLSKVFNNFFGVLRQFPAIFDYLVLELTCLELFKILPLECSKFWKNTTYFTLFFEKKIFFHDNHKTGSLVQSKLFWGPNFF